MKKLLGIVVLGLLWIIPVSADDNCVDKNPEIIDTISFIFLFPNFLNVQYPTLSNFFLYQLQLKNIL